MTQSAGPIETGPTACPFVALDNDRDARSQVPDERHRCYAENVPAPRTFAHQDRFCLSPDFAGCPVFAEWALRAAARPTPGAGASAGAAAAAAAVPADPAPELWVERFDKNIHPERDENWPDSMAAAPPAAAAPAAAGSAETESQQMAAFASPAAPIIPEPVTTPGEDDDRGFDPAPLPTFLSARSPRARGRPESPAPNDNVAAVADANVRRSSSGRRDDNGDGAFTRLLTMAAVVIILALGVATVLIVPGLLAGDPGQTGRPSLVAGASRPPTALASVVAADPSVPNVGPTVAPVSSPPEPAATPTPTPRSYKVQPGDSLRRIARQFGVTVTDILAANPTIPDADHVEVGQRLLIPAPP